MKDSFRILYRQLILISFYCLCVTVLTGIIVGLNNRLIQLPDRIFRILIGIHQGGFLGDKLAPIYALLLGLGVFVLGFRTITQGKYINLLSTSASSFTNLYLVATLILVIPLAVCVETGLAYRLGKDWFGMSSNSTAGFLSVHGGSSFETPWNIMYLLLASTALIALLILSHQSNIIPQKQIKQTLGQQIKTTQNYAENNVFLSKKVKLTIAYALIAIFSILFYLTSASWVAIAIAVIAIILLAAVWDKNLIKSRKRQKPALTIPQELEVESITMLRAIPDSMLRISQNGICLSYLPAKEANSFVLHGNIVNKHISEFLAPKIVGQFMASTRSSLQSGLTDICRFSISADSEEQCYEARINPIGGTEVLILVREIDSSSHSLAAAQHFVAQQNTAVIEVLTESELIQALETKLSNDWAEKYILMCLSLTIDGETNNRDVVATGNTDAAIIDIDSLSTIATTINSLLPSSTIARLDDNNLVVLVSDRTIETASILVDDLYLKLNELSITGQNNFDSVKFNIALLEINADNFDAASSIDAVKTACQMAKQKINLKTF